MPSQCPAAIGPHGRRQVAKIYNYHIQTLLGRSGRIKCLKLSPDEKKMVYCSNDETVCAADIAIPDPCPSRSIFG